MQWDKDEARVGTGGGILPFWPRHSGQLGNREMILVAVVAELLEEYTVVVARVLEHLLHDAPFPRRVRFLILRRLPFVSPSPPPPPP
ncbi:unnamed protein product, partial [Linum tenue]